MTIKRDKEQTVGILAYGSLISNPGDEIERACTETIYDVLTPFPVEFARSSKGRGGAPTLVPVSSGGAQVKGQVFVMDVSETEAANILYRRETNKVGDSLRTYRQPKDVTENTVLVERQTNFAGLDVVLYTKIAATIEPLTAEHLASLAIESFAKTDPNRDGISYLKDAKNDGIVTALSSAYEVEILKEVGCASLDDARKKLAAAV